MSDDEETKREDEDVAEEPKVAKKAAQKKPVDVAAKAKAEAALDAALAAAKGGGAARKVRLKILRQDAPDLTDTRRWESFTVDWLPQMNVNSCLEQIRRAPRTSDGKAVSPVAWEAACLEEVCGSCTMLVNGRVRQACSTLVDSLPKDEEIVLEPLTKFPLERDLVVDRSRMFASLKQVKAWITLDGSHALGPGPRESQTSQAERYALARCMSCGSCLEACPQYAEDNAFIGAAAISQARLFNKHPSGKADRVERLESLMVAGGVADCGKAQVCVEVCPKEIPLVDSIAEVARDTTKHLLFGWLLK